MLMGNTLTKYAEIGAATIPPRLKAITANINLSDPKKIMKLKAADDVTKIHLLRLFQSHIVVEFLLESRSGVLTGPQPPPPIASKNPQNLVELL